MILYQNEVLLFQLMKSKENEEELRTETRASKVEGIMQNNN